MPIFPIQIYERALLPPSMCDSTSLQKSPKVATLIHSKNHETGAIARIKPPALQSRRLVRLLGTWLAFGELTLPLSAILMLVEITLLAPYCNIPGLQRLHKAGERQRSRTVAAYTLQH